MVFLAVTAEWGHPGSEVEMSAPAQADLARPPKKAAPVARAPIELPTAAMSGASDQADIDDTASIADLPQAVEPEAAIEAPSPAAGSDAEAATEGTALNAETADARPDEGRPDPAPGNDTSVDMSVSEGDVHVDASPHAVLAEPSEPASPVAGSITNAGVENGTSKTASVERPAPAAAAAHSASKAIEAEIAKPTQPKSAGAGSTSKAGVENGTSKTVSAEPTTAKVTTPSATPKAGLDKPRLKRPTPPQEEASQPRGTSPWKPLALAPADKPSTSLTQAPTSRPSGGNYGAQVWSALARHKPKAGESGSTTVVFAIGDAGALRFVRVGRSSGNARLDQLALATVRNAAPYPAPPGGAQSFTIRIDFH
jgi:periplasmic protein TonB